MKHLHYMNGRNIALTKLGFGSGALKTMLASKGLSMGAGAALGGAVDSDNRLRGAALGAGAGLAGHSVANRMKNKIPATLPKSLSAPSYIDTVGETVL